MTDQSQLRRRGRRTARVPDPSPATGLRPQGRTTLVVSVSLATGVLLSLGLALSPVVPPRESSVTGAVLVGFAAGWAILAVLSARFTSTPQRWAAVPSAFLASGGLLLLAFGSSIRPAIDWLWPPAALVLVAWAIPHVRRLPGTGGRRQLTCVLVLLGVAAIGASYQSVGEALDARRVSMPGQLVDVGGHRLHLQCIGSGSPTVVLEPGAGEMAANLAWITPAVARTTRVCAYDRAGRGGSDPAVVPQSGARIADDLHTLLERAGIPGPYVLAGHSFGGLYVLAFAARYPDDVAGMVLIDSTAPADAATSPASGDLPGGGTTERVSAVLSTVSRLGVSRVYARAAFGGLPETSRDAVRASVATAPATRSALDEYLMGAASTTAAAAASDLGDTPLAVLSAGAGHPESWYAAQDHLATLSTRVAHRVVDGATHEDLVADPTYAAVTARAVTDVVTTVRAGR